MAHMSKYRADGYIQEIGRMIGQGRMGSAQRTMDMVRNAYHSDEMTLDDYRRVQVAAAQAKRMA